MSPVWRTVFGFGAYLCVAHCAAAVVSYDLDQSNALPDGRANLRVTIDDEGLAGRINFHVAVLGSLLDAAGPNFGIQTFAFNSPFSLSSAKIAGLPANWQLEGGGNMSGFGRFSADIAAKTGNARMSTLSFSITGIAQDTITSYLRPSSGRAAEGNYFFAAHVAGFNWPGEYCVTSAWFAGSNPVAPAAVPLPAAAWLLLAGLGALLAAARGSRMRPALISQSGNPLA